MDEQARDSKRKYVADESPVFHFTASEPVPKKPKYSQQLSRLAEARFWRLPVELKDMITANVSSLRFFQTTRANVIQLTKCDLMERFVCASVLKQRDGIPAGTHDMADYFLSALYHEMEFCLDPESLPQLKYLIEGSTVHNFSLIKSVLFDTFATTSKVGLEPILHKFPRTDANLRIASFTMESTIGLESLPALKQFFSSSSPSLEVIVVPTWYDGDITNISTMHDNAAATENLTSPWTLLKPKTAKQLEHINYHNKIATPDGLALDDKYHEAHILQQTGPFNMHVALKRKRIAPINAPGHHSERLDVLSHWNAPVGLWRSLVAENNGYKVRGFSIFAEPPIAPRPALPLGPIVAGMGWSRTIALQELRLSYIDCTTYGKGLLSSEPDDVPATFSFSSLKLLKINGCMGNAEFLHGLRKQSADVETFLFSVHDQHITTDEEEAIVQLVRSSSNLRSLSLGYTTPPVVKVSSPYAGLPGILNDYLDDPNDDFADDKSAPNARQDEVEAVSNVQPPQGQSSVWVTEYSRFPLARLFGPVNYTIRSLALTQSLRSEMSHEDLSYIGIVCPYLTDLAIACPLIEIAVIDNNLDAHMKAQLKGLANVLRAYPHLKYLQLVARGDERYLYYDVSPLESITRQVIKHLSECGLSIDFFTVALRSLEHKDDMGAETCHLRVRSNPELHETISDKALKRDMETFGDVISCSFEHFVPTKTGSVYDYFER
ncbi:uncharacterized protein J4E92_005907 [Alternaria infectoria]|uniref:uncharacterized protein n=1 Tax=Alternaria infectoria TaxID=45303 RepID=UPI0022209DFA|nr:uncharacterized protein J4E92_005907 [Alternaria infectoria]KAI4928421.1 hypothetical protein J4E92_005907 [Alternaria infectoria]